MLKRRTNMKQRFVLIIAIIAILLIIFILHLFSGYRLLGDCRSYVARKTWCNCCFYGNIPDYRSPLREGLLAYISKTVAQRVMIGWCVFWLLLTPGHWSAEYTFFKNRKQSKFHVWLRLLFLCCDCALNKLLYSIKLQPLHKVCMRRWTPKRQVINEIIKNNKKNHRGAIWCKPM